MALVFRFIIILSISGFSCTWSEANEFYVYNIDNNDLSILNEPVLLNVLPRRRRDTDKVNNDGIIDGQNNENQEQKNVPKKLAIPIKNSTDYVNKTANSSISLLDVKTSNKSESKSSVLSKEQSTSTVNPDVNSSIFGEHNPELLTSPANILLTSSDREEINSSEISKFFGDDGFLNATKPDVTFTKGEVDYHVYYNSSFLVDPSVGHSYWVNMSNEPEVKIHDMLSQSYRRAATVRLKFDFPFYGHNVRNVTVATGGFLYTGDYVHSWLASTQYIAPLMANFDTSISNKSVVKYVDNGTSFTVQWENVNLQDRPEGNFTFQATLHNNGDIIFVYKDVPILIAEIKDDKHPVKVGLSDAYIIDRTIFFVRRKTIYEYHRVNFNRDAIRNWTVIYLKALPTCLSHLNCEDCLTMNTNFKCSWCSSANRCSNGKDRHKQDWDTKGCDREQITDVSMCSSIHPFSGEGSSISHKHNMPAHGISSIEGSDYGKDYEDKSGGVDGLTKTISAEPVSKQDYKSSVGISGGIGIMFTFGIILGLGVWLLYAYRNPHTASGQFVIRYRPSQWSWRRGEARYTAATVHM